MIFHEHNSEVGELVIGGSQVMEGYWNGHSIERQSNYFVNVNGNTYYKTGDYVKKDDNDCIYFLYRRDDIVKINGKRVCLKEIERVALSHPHVKEAQCRYYASKKSIVLNISSDVLESAQGIFNDIRNNLPKYMQPNDICISKKLKRGCNGKVELVQDHKNRI